MRPRPPFWLIDVILALFVVVLGQADVRRQEYMPDAVAIGAVAATCALIGFRRREPIVTLALMLAVQTVTAAPSAEEDPGYYFLAAQVFTFTIGLQHQLRLAVPGVLGAVVWFVLFNLLRGANETDAIIGSVLWILPAALGQAVRHTRAAQEAAAAAAQTERSRIARELHDAVAHNLGAMVLQSGALRRRLGPEQSSERESLEAIERTGRDAAIELRRMLGILRADAQPPGLDRLEELADSMRHAGLNVEIDEQGRRVLRPALAEAAYRIVQAALANSLEHARPGTSAAVTLVYAPDELVIEVDDDGEGTPVATGADRGHGITGMRERAAVFGGTIEAGPRPEGGYRVRATLPDQPLD